MVYNSFVNINCVVFYRRKVTMLTGNNQIPIEKSLFVGIALAVCLPYLCTHLIKNNHLHAVTISLDMD